jgi:tagaturonate reductase
VKEFHRRTGQLPRRLVFSLAALIAFYRGTEFRDGGLVGLRAGQEYPIRDDAPVLELFDRVWTRYESRGDAREVARTVLAEGSIWGEDLNDLPGLTEAAAADLEAILRNGVTRAMGGR